MGIAVMIVLLAGALALIHAPFELARLRVAGISLLWWYSLFVAPLVATGAAVPLLRRRSD